MPNSKPAKPIWVLEDDPACRFVYEDALALRYHLVMHSSIAELAAALSGAEPDGSGRKPAELPALIIADLRLPDGDFLEFLGRAGPRPLVELPFIVVSSIDDLDILRACFDEGAMDYLTKPFTRNELIVKVERLLRRDDVVLDADHLKVKRGESAFAQLTAKELQIFALLHRAGGKPVSRLRIEAEVWQGTHVGAKALDVHFFNLRRKLAHLGMEIRHQSPHGFSLSSDRMD